MTLHVFTIALDVYELCTVIHLHNIILYVYTALKEMHGQHTYIHGDRIKATMLHVSTVLAPELAVLVHT